MEPVVSRGRGMHILGFVPLGGLRTTPIAPKVPAAPRDERGGGGQVPESNGVVGAAGRDADNEVRGPSSWKHGRPVYTHGNYSRYYNYRQAEGGQGAEDLRLGALTKHLGRKAFRGKEVLDVGCNDGIISHAIAHSFGAKRVVGVDIDADLIERAKAKSGMQEPTSGSSTAGTNGHCVVEFRAENFLSSPLRRPPAMEPERFDVVLCLSVTKWVHFANGDKGITRLFKRCIKRLRPGGLFVLEPQLWASYKKKRHISPEIRETVASIQLRPEAFDGYIVDSLGLESAGTIAPSAEMPKGFQRPIYLYRKPHPPPDAAGAEAAEGQDEVVPPEQPAKKKKRLHSEARVEVAEGEDEVSPQEQPKKKKRREEAAGAEAAVGQGETAPTEQSEKKARRLRREAAGAEAAEGQDEVDPPEQAKKKKKRRPDTEESAGVEAAEGQDEATPQEQAKKKKRRLHAEVAEAEAAEGQDEVDAPERPKKKKNRLPGTEAAPPQDAAAPPKKTKKKNGQADTR